MKLNIENALAFVEKSDYDNLLNEAVEGRTTLLTRTGAGHEFTDWFDVDEKVTGDVDDIIATAQQIQDMSEVFVVIGVGGSYLGARAALEFINSPNYNLMSKNTPEVYFAGNYMSSDAIAEILAIIGNRDFSINVISKSGTTTEPAIAFRIFRERLEQKYGRKGAASRIFVTTDKSKGALRKVSQEKGYKSFVVPDGVGGRYSVISPVGLLPLAVAGVDIKALLKGTRDAIEHFKVAPAEENDALKYAAIRNCLYRMGKKVEIFADFEPALRFTGEWWKQLFGESEGKEGKALFPASVDYSADLHSMGQYIQQGERIMLETFVVVENSRTALVVPHDAEVDDELEYLAGKTVLWANSQVHAAVEKAHFDGGVPNLTVTIKDMSAMSFGELIGFFMFACGVSGYVLGINPFDQPGVEEYKKNMYRMLGKPGFTD